MLEADNKGQVLKANVDVEVSLDWYGFFPMAFYLHIHEANMASLIIQVPLLQCFTPIQIYIGVYMTFVYRNNI